MKSFISIVLVLMVAMVSCGIIPDKNCLCDLEVVGDGVGSTGFVGYSMDQHVASCTEDEACKRKCVNMMNQGTDNGSLASNAGMFFRPSMTIGDFVCQAFTRDVDVGVGSIYARLCGGKPMKTDFKFQTDFCCRNRKHKDHCAA